MKLIERDNFLAAMNYRFKQAVSGEGHCFFIAGEAGIGKTSLVRTFLKEIEDKSIVYTGACDALFTPRPLAPLYDIALQINADWPERIQSIPSRTELFIKFFQALTRQDSPVVLVFEDVHWADEATLDFAKFFSRRISLTKCLFILTYRDNETSAPHYLRNLPGDLMPGTFTYLLLTPLSRQAVQQLADEKGYNGEDVYTITGGNPFYVNEILASYSPGVPDNIRNAILSVYNRQEEKTKEVWQLLSIMPEGLELTQAAKIDPSLQNAIEHSLATKILVIENNKVSFKHELYRRTIESSISPFKRIDLNKYVLSLFLEDFKEELQIERIIHHAKNANENRLVTQYAPIAAKEAAFVGAHVEAAKLFYTAIEYADRKDTDSMVMLYEAYAYECYLTNQMKEAIIYQTKALKIWEERNNVEQTGNSLRFLSQLWWHDGNQKQANAYGWQAIEVLDKQPSSKAKAMAYSNMSKLKMESDETNECIYWGEKAVTIAQEIGDEDTLTHALNCMGTTLMLIPSSMTKGIALLQQSLDIALKNSNHEYVACAYSALGSNGVTIKDYPYAKKTLEAGIQYCEKHDITSLKLEMLAWNARQYLETGNWKEAFNVASNVLEYENLSPHTKIAAQVVVATIKIRRGERDAVPLISEAIKKALETTELFRIVPTFLIALEYEWITGERIIEANALLRTINMIFELKKFSKKSRFYFWLRKTKKEYLLPREIDDSEPSRTITFKEEAAFWEKMGSPYEMALSLFEGTEDDKRRALLIVQELGADAVYQKLKMDMRTSGIKRIPRGLRESTKTNPAQLTNRELDILSLLKEGIQNKEIAGRLFVSSKTVDHHISSILFKLDVNTRNKAVKEAMRLGIIPTSNR
jgi:DNA-binding CsgD family transcriptional regulator